MTKKENSVKKKESSEFKTAKKEAGSSFGDRFREGFTFLRSEQARKIFALFLMMFSVFLLVAFISHFFSGPQDQSIVETGPLGNPEIEKPTNLLGSLGAWFAYRFITLGFGLPALLIPVFVGILGFTLLENNHYHILKIFLKYFLFVLLWGSAALSFFSFLFTQQSGDLGGGFGRYLNESCFNYVGKLGMGFLILISLLVFLVVNFNTDLRLSRLAGVFSGFAKDAKEKEEELAEEEKIEKEEEEIGEISLALEGSDEGLREKEGLKKNPEDFILSVRKENGAILIPEKEHENLLDGDPEMEPVGEFIKPTVTPTGDLELELEIETKSENEEVSGSFTLGPEDDNIIEVEDDTYEKYVPEEDQETLDEDEDVGDWEQFDPTKELSTYQFPPIELLNKYDTQSSKEINRGELEENKNKIVTTLLNYKIEITHIKATIGPTVTLYEIVPAPGVRISKIKNLEDDIALSLSALGIRIIAPIPGKGTIGIEIPNSNPEIVSMRSTLATEKFRETKAELPLALGRTISNEVYIADLTKMPHMLIAGATGQGKSVGINGVISSILYKKHPAQVKFVLIDPKKVELNLYNDLVQHFLAKLENGDDAIITDTRQVIGVLNSLCIEMDTRYDLLKKAKVRNLREYNEKFVNRRLSPKKGHKYMPYIVLIIDEFADLMMTAGKEIEAPIARLAQLARAIGIHLILATQRPSVNVITGIIKANFPARVSYRVTSKVDSRTILDTGGADQLIGRGDMLFSTGSELIRIQNAFIDTPEVEALVKFIADQRGYSTPYYLPEVPEDNSDKDDDLDLGDERDEMFAEAARLVVKHQQGSTSLIQRRLKLGYNRAGRIIDQLERAGIVGPFSGSKARDVLIQDEYGLEQILNGMD